VLPWLYILDVINIVFSTGGVFGLKTYNIFNIIEDVLSGIVLGKYFTKIKDFAFEQLFDQTSQSLTKSSVLVNTKHKSFQEISSMFVWSVMAFIYLEIISKKSGFALGSVFALGGKLS